MKRTIVFLILIFSCEFMHSQEVNCHEKTAQLTAFVNEKNYAKAYDVYKEINVKCASHSETLYLQTVKILQYKIDIAAADKKQLAVDELLQWYDLYDKNFPENKNSNSINKALLLVKNKSSNTNEIYNLLDKTFKKDKYQFVNPNALYTYFKLFNDKFNDKNNAITFENYIEKYSLVLNVIEKNRTLNAVLEADFDNALIAVKSLVTSNFTNQNLVSYTEKYFESNKNNSDWLLTFANLLSDKNLKEPIFGTIAAQLHQINPTSKSAYYLADYNLLSSNKSKALELYDQSALLATDKKEKAEIFYKIASLVSVSDKAKAKKMITTAIENDAVNAKYYIFLANQYGNSVDKCSTNELEKKAILKLANLNLQKAEQVEPRFKTTVVQLAKQYQVQALTNEELVEIKKTDNKITIGCWINETVQF